MPILTLSNDFVCAPRPRLPSNEFSAPESFGIIVGPVALPPSKTEEGLEELLRKRALTPPALEAHEHAVDSPAPKQVVDRHQDGCRAEVAVVLRNLVLQDEVIPKCLPDELGEELEEILFTLKYVPSSRSAWILFWAEDLALGGFCGYRMLQHIGLGHSLPFHEVAGWPKTNHQKTNVFLSVS
jgi:hypothetical protein